jgi:hypothetical protein
MLDLINDAFGNYLVQKIAENLDEAKLDWMINLVTPFFLDISFSPHGTRVIQKIIECLSTEQLLEKFNRIFLPNIYILSKDVNSNHIVQKYIYTIRYPHNQYLFEIMIKDLAEISTDKHGCCVMQKLVDASEGAQKVITNILNFQNFLIEIILKRTLSFISDQYANYVLQFILSLNDYNINKTIAELFIPTIGYLSKQKFSSNVIEKVLYC